MGGGTVTGYSAFLETKDRKGDMSGFDPVWMPDFLFDFQQDLVEWALLRGRCALFEDCGLGKTPQQLVWAENVVRHTNRPVLILTPLAVSQQTIIEAEKFGIGAHRSRTGEVRPGINVTNYERLHYFNPADFAGVVCDESSILKSFDGATRGAVTEFMRNVPYRLLCTATAAPNDYVELGTSAEALGVMKHREMLARFFTHDGGDTSKWRLKGYAQERPFWEWMCSWSRAIRRPSDIGFDDARFVLPELREQEHVVNASRPLDGHLFALPAVGLDEQRAERRHTLRERCEKISELVSHKEQALVWCHMNDEGDLLESLIPDATQVSGSDADGAKEDAFMAFVGGQIRVLVTKPKIGAWGLNFQNCAHVTFFPSHSFEQYYQGVRRCWRFGQKRPVVVDVVTTEGEREVMRNLQRKGQQADQMFVGIVQHMKSATVIPPRAPATTPERMPAWL